MEYLSDADKIDLLTESLSAISRRGLKLRTPDIDAEKGLQTWTSIQKEKDKLPEMTMKFFMTKQHPRGNITDFFPLPAYNMKVIKM